MPLTVYPLRKSGYRVLFAVGGFLFLMPLGLGILLTLSNPGAGGAFVVIGLIMMPPGLILFSMGAAYRKLSIGIDKEAGILRVALPRTTAILFPWQVKPASVPLSAISRVDAKWRANPYVAGGLEGLYFIRTGQGDFHFNSKWFPDYEALVARLTEFQGVETTEENLELPPVTVEGEAPPKLLVSEKAMRGCGFYDGAPALCSAGDLLWQSRGSRGGGESRARPLGSHPGLPHAAALPEGALDQAVFRKEEIFKKIFVFS